MKAVTFIQDTLLPTYNLFRPYGGQLCLSLITTVNNDATLTVQQGEFVRKAIESFENGNHRHELLEKTIQLATYINTCHE